MTTETDEQWIVLVRENGHLFACVGTFATKDAAKSYREPDGVYTYEIYKLYPPITSAR